MATELRVHDVFPKDDGTDYKKLFEAAQKGNKKAYAAVAVHLDPYPGLWERIGDMARRARTMWITTSAQGDLVAAEGIRRRLASLRDELSGPDPSPLERLLVERVLLCWIQVYFLEQQLAALMQESHATQQADHYQKRVDRAHYRFLAAVRTLAVTRKLLTPSIQVGPVAQLNVSDNAVNLVGDTQQHRQQIPPHE